MRIVLFYCFFLAFPLHSLSQISNAEQLLQAMQERYKGKWCSSLTFTQSTYRPNDSLNRHMTWYEAIQYPDKFRIDFNSTTKGNAAIFCNDSAFSFRKGKLVSSHPDKNDIILILGGWYFRTLEDVTTRLKEENYDLGRFSENTWRKQPVYVIGASAGDTIANQIWIDQKTFRVVRTLTRATPFQELDMQVDDFMKAGGGFLETKLSFYVNGKLDQQEAYHDIQLNVKLDPAVFDPAQFGKVHWKKTPVPTKK
jgi:outer membrane lipoprotein-sorting protein